MQISIEKELEGIQAGIHGLASHKVELVQPGRRFIMHEELTRLKKSGPAKHPYCVYLFNDMILFCERSSKRSAAYKYVSHMYIKDIFFIECTDSKEKYAFGIMNKDEKKKKMKFAAKEVHQKGRWKQALEKQIEKHCPTDTTFGSGESMVTFGSPKNSWTGSDELFGFASSLGSACDLESCDDRSTNAESPPYESVDWSANSDSDASYDESEENRSETSEDSDIDGTAGTVGKLVTYDGINVLSHAPLHTILWWAITHGDYSDPILIKTFLHSCVTFTTPEAIFDNLIQIYNLVLPVPKEITVRYSICDTRRKVTQFVKVWVEYFFERDVGENPLLYVRLLDLIAEMQKHSQMQDANALKLLIIRVNKKNLERRGYNRFQILEREKEREKNEKLSSKSRSERHHSVAGPSSSLQPVSDSKFSDWSITAVAEQFVLIEFALFKAVELKEITNMAWKSETPRKTAVNVINFFTRFDMVSQWVATEVVMATSLKVRVTIIEKMIQLANKCLELRNFNSLMEIVAGLNRGSVQRLKKAWEGVATSARETFRSMNNVVDSLANYKSYRELLRKSPLPCLPYFGIFLRDLTFTDIGNPTKIGDNINFEKIYMTSRILKDIQNFQRTSYSYEEDAELQPLLRRLLVMPEEMLYKHSQMVEPPVLAGSREISPQ